MPNIVNDPIFMFHPLHNKLSLIKQFVRALCIDGECFQRKVFALPPLSFDTIKAGVRDEPQNRAVVRDQGHLSQSLSGARSNGGTFLVSKPVEDFKALLIIAILVLMLKNLRPLC